MNRRFWNDMVEIWCRAADQRKSEEIAKIAEQYVRESIKKKSGYSRNPLDDEDDEDDDEDFEW